MECGPVIEYRSFLNTDPPALIDIWQSQPPMRCLATVLSPADLDQMVLAKPYFDAAGLILAVDDGKPIGFVHAGFGPAPGWGGIDQSVGIISQLRVIESDQAAELSHELLTRAASYLADSGSTICYAGSKFPCSPFYLGLYGGSRIPGIPIEDGFMSVALQRFGFQTGERILVFQRNLQEFRPPISRSQMAVRRMYQVIPTVDPMLPNWWDCCSFGWSEIFGFRVSQRSDQQVVGSVLFWEIQPLSKDWGQLTMGLVEMQIDEFVRGQGLATFLIGESLRHLAAQRVASVEVQLRESNEPAISVARRMGFEQISEGREMTLSLMDYRKTKVLPSEVS